MEIGKLLREKYGFDEPKARIEFTCKYNYGAKFLLDVLDDHFPELLAGHINDISEFTGVPVEELLKLQTPKPEGGIGHPIAPLGRPWRDARIIMTLNIADIKKVINNER